MSDSIPYALFERRSQARYRMWTNSKPVVYNYGAALKLRYTLANAFLLDYNISFAKLKRTGSDDGLEDGFNTPPWMMTISLTKDNILKRFGAGIMYRWQDSFYWQSFLVNGNVPAQGAIDAQINYTFPKRLVHIKAGAGNLINRYQASFLGGPQAGGFYYSTLTFQLQ